MKKAKARATKIGAVKEGRQIGHISDPKYAKWFTPMRPKTAREMLERHEEGDLTLTDAQRKKYEALASPGSSIGQTSKNPLAKRVGESSRAYLARIQSLAKAGKLR